MLYETWRCQARELRSEMAARDAASGREWTFGQFHAAAEAIPKPAEAIVFPRGTFPEFLVDILAGWRHGKVVCPMSDQQASQPFIQAPPNCAHLKYTSATTGNSRMVAFTGEQLAADVDNIVATMGLRREWPNLGVISTSHSYGFSNLVLPLLLRGIPLIHVASPLPREVASAAKGSGDITLAAVPAMWRAWHQSGCIPLNTRLAISAGAPLPISLEGEIYRERGLKVHNFYGSTECGGIAYDGGNAPRTDESFAGNAMRGVQLAISPEGCLQVRGRAVGQSYWPDASPNLANGTFHTSDLAELKGASVHLRGRLTDLIHVAGRKVSPESIERALRKHPRVRDCLVFGAPSADETRGEVIVAACVGDISIAEMKAHLLALVPAWQVPREWHILQALDYNERGKISRAEWRNSHLGRLRGEGSA